MQQHFAHRTKVSNLLHLVVMDRTEKRNQVRREAFARIKTEFKTNVALANALGDEFSPSYVSQLLNGHRGIGDDVATKIEDRLRLPRGSLDEEKETETGPSLRGKVPLISWVQAGQWSEISDQFPPGDAEGWRETTARVGAGAFALRIMGDSMEPTIPRGSVVIIDPSAEAANGRVVVVRQRGDSEATIKRLVIEGGVRYLKPDNPRYPIMEMRADAVICGVAVKVEQDL